MIGFFFWGRRCCYTCDYDLIDVITLPFCRLSIGGALASTNTGSARVIKGQICTIVCSLRCPSDGYPPRQIKLYWKLHWQYQLPSYAILLPKSLLVSIVIMIFSSLFDGGGICWLISFFFLYYFFFFHIAASRISLIDRDRWWHPILWR